MTKTNIKEVKQSVRAYLLECVDESWLEEMNLTDSEPGAIFSALFEQMKSEYWIGYERKRYPNRETAFIQWLMGLPVLTVDYYYDDMRNLLAKWLEETPEESAKYDDSKVSDLFYHLMAREFFAVLDQWERKQEKKDSQQK